MFRFTADTLEKATGGRLLSRPAKADHGFSLSTDSRNITSHQVFFALHGPSFDGHDFVEAVLDKPNTGIVGRLERLEQLPTALYEGRLVLAVEDPLTALGEAASFIRNSFDGPVVGLTGSVGKTTTKDLLRSVLERTGPGLATVENYNNFIGLPLTLARLEPEHRWAVLEMGMNAFGEIRRMAEIARPNVRLITNVGAAHTEGLGGLDGVARAKEELFSTARAGDTVVVFLDDHRVRSMSLPEGVRRVTFGRSADADVQMIRSLEAPEHATHLQIKVRGKPLELRLSLLGAHNAMNATAAAATCVALQVPAETIREGIEAATISAMRMQIVQVPDEIKVLNDAYNANPISMAAALRTLMEVRPAIPGGRRVAVLGDMLELGPLEVEAHRCVGTLVAELGVERLYLCGKRATEIKFGAMAAGMERHRIFHSEDHVYVATAMDGWLRRGDIVLLKGSRGARMEKILEELQRLRA